MKTIIKLSGKVVSQSLFLPAVISFTLPASELRAEEESTLSKVYELMELSSAANYETAAQYTAAKARYAAKMAEYRKAAEQGDARAQCVIAECYFQGYFNPKRGVDKSNIAEINKNTSEGLKWIRKAAEGGFGEAQRELAWHYRDGKGLPKDLVTGYMWLELGFASDPEREQAVGESVRKKYVEGMTPEQIAEGKRLSTEWKPKSITPDPALPKASQDSDGKEIKFESLLGYKKVIVIKVEPDGIRIRHEDGIKKIKFEELPEDIRSKFGMSEAAAMEHRAASKEIEVAQAEIDKAAEFARQFKISIYGEAFQVVGGEGILLRFGSGKNAQKKPVDLPDIVFVECNTSEIVDGAMFKADIYPYGTYSYEAVSGAEKTVRRFTTSFLSAAEFAKGEK